MTFSQMMLLNEWCGSTWRYHPSLRYVKFSAGKEVTECAHITKSISELQCSSKKSKAKSVNTEGESHVMLTRSASQGMWSVLKFWLTYRVSHNILLGVHHLRLFCGTGKIEKSPVHSMGRGVYRWCVGSVHEAFDQVDSDLRFIVKM
jgi:hypothetical protein